MVVFVGFVLLRWVFGLGLRFLLFLRAFLLAFGLIFFFGQPVEFPAKGIKNLLEKFATIDMFHVAHAGDKTVDIALTVGGEAISGAVAIIAHAFARNNEARIDHGANEGDALVGWLFVLLLGMESELELGAEIFFDNFDIAQELLVLVHRHQNEEVVHIASIMFIAEVKLDVAVELVEENIGEELTGEIADHDPAAFGLIEEAFAGRKLLPIGASTTDGDFAHGFVKNHFVPEIFESIIETLAVIGVAADIVLFVGAGAVIELLVQSPENAFVELFMIQAHEIPLDVKLDGVGGDGVILCNLTEVMGEAFLAIERAFALATGI